MTKHFIVNYDNTNSKGFSYIPVNTLVSIYCDAYGSIFMEAVANTKFYNMRIYATKADSSDASIKKEVKFANLLLDQILAKVDAWIIRDNEPLLYMDYVVKESLKSFNEGKEEK